MSKSKHVLKINIGLLLFRIISLIIILVCLYFIWNWYKENKKTSGILSKIEQTVSFDEISSNNFSSLLTENSNTVGWIRVNNTNINYPVVQHTDNSYYLTHSFNNEYNSAGWIFVDYRNKLDGTDKNIIIYGHNRMDGSMFASLKNVLNKDWYTNEDNYKINLYTINGTKTYEIFSIYKIESENYYTTTSFNSTNEYSNFLNTVKNRSIYNFNVELNNRDSILTLSTCANNNKYRVVLHAKKIN